MPEQPRVEERVADPQAAHDGRDARDDRDDRQHRGDDGRVGAAGLGSARLPSRVRDPRPPTRKAENRIAPTTSSRPGPRGVSQPPPAAQATTRATIAMGTLT